MLALFIEDEPNNVEVVRMYIQEEMPNTTTSVVEFDDARDAVINLQPDIVVLDILRGGYQSVQAPDGLNVREFIWNARFCPIVVYSAQPELHDQQYGGHPFVKSVRKGSGSEDLVIQAFNELRDVTESIRSTEAEIRRQLGVAMRETAIIAAENVTDVEHLAEIVTRSARRRVAALMDEPAPDGKALVSWEQYLYPPVSDDILLGDILQRSGEGNNARSFRVVLTPSCDMVRSGGRTAKVQQILTAKCYPMQEALDDISLTIRTTTPRNLSESRNRIRSRLLSQGYSQGVIPVPPLPGIIPAMAANLKDLELIPLASIGSGVEYHVIASTDSPFRELVSWAYLQIACRPGLPDRDLDHWADEIVSTVQAEDVGNR